VARVAPQGPRARARSSEDGRRVPERSGRELHLAHAVHEPGGPRRAPPRRRGRRSGSPRAGARETRCRGGAALSRSELSRHLRVLRTARTLARFCVGGARLRARGRAAVDVARADGRDVARRGRTAHRSRGRRYGNRARSLDFGAVRSEPTPRSQPGATPARAATGFRSRPGSAP
jgi:hypothetical protein